MVSADVIISGVLSVSLLVFFAKILAGAFSKIKMPAVLGDLFAGIIFGPYALGGYLVIFGHKLIELSEVVLVFSEIGAILILFTAGLEMTFAEFKAVGLKSFVVGGVGVIVPFSLGYYLTLFLGYPFPAALIVGAALTATSIAITVKVLEELGKTTDPDAKVMINAAVVDDVLGLATLAIVVSIIQAGQVPSFFQVTEKLITILALWVALLVGVVFTVPRFLGFLTKWQGRVEGTEEAAATVACFGSSSLAIILGLSPIVGAYAAGMAIAGSRSLTTIKGYIAKINLIFSPIFFAVIGASLNLASFSLPVLLLLFTLLIIALLSKIIGCGLPAAFFSRSWRSGWKIGVGMTSRGEVGLIISGIGLAEGVINQDVYAALIGVVILTTIISPILLRSIYQRNNHEKLDVINSSIENA